MAVIVSDNRNPSYDGNLSTVNGFYRVEFSNLRALYGDIIAINTPRVIPITFANGGIFKGFITALSYATVPTDRSVSCTLQEAKTCTVAVASPGIVTIANHGLSEGQEICFSTTGTFLTGITPITVLYYVRNPTQNTFNISSTPSAALLNFTGTQSGVHTCWISRDNVTLTYDQILTPKPGRTSHIGFYTYVPFKFEGGYTVDTTVNKWQIRIYSTAAGTTGTYNILTTVSSGTVYCSAVWCDTQISHTDNDTLVVVDLIEIDKTAAIRGILSAGDTTDAIAAIVCRSLGNSEDGFAKLRWKRNPVASYTFTVDGGIVIGFDAGVECGTRSNPIPYAKQAIWYFKTRTVGTANSGISFCRTSTSSRPSSGSSIIFCGEIPTHRFGILASDAVAGQNKITLTEDKSLSWNVGDRVYVGKSDVQGQGSVVVNTISSFNGAEITLNANIATNNRLTGGYVINFSRGYGIYIYSQSQANPAIIMSADPNFFTFTGIYSFSVSLIAYSNSRYFIYAGYGNIPLPNQRKHEIEDCLFESGGTTFTSGMSIQTIGELGASVQRNLAFRCTGLYNVGAYYHALRKSGRLLYKDNISLAIYTVGPGVPTTTNFKADFINNVIQNGYDAVSIYNQNTVSGIGCTYIGNTIWGCNVGLLLGSSVNAILKDNVVDKCRYGMLVQTGSIILNFKDENSIFGVAAANGSNYISTGIYADMLIQSPSGDFTLDTTNMLDSILGTKIKIADNNDTINNDLVYSTFGNFQRCGDGLADATVHTSGTNKFSLRFSPNNNADTLDWQQYVPTGNIQSKTMAVSVWVKINSNVYYTGVHIKPTLRVNYDNGSILEIVSTPNTEWQLLTAVFTPTTTFGQIEITILGSTDAVSPDSYFYVDDMSVFFPAGSSLNLGGMDLWANAMPITPSIATVSVASDSWAFPEAAISGEGTIGKKIKDNLDAAISTRLSASSYEAPDNAGIAAIPTNPLLAENYVIPDNSSISDILVKVLSLNNYDDSIIGLSVTIIKKLVKNKLSREGDIISIYEDDGETLFTQFNVGNQGRVEI